MTKREMAWLTQYHNECWGARDEARRAWYADPTEENRVLSEKALSAACAVDTAFNMLVQRGHIHHVMRCETCAIHETPQCMLTMIEKGHMTFINHDPKFFLCELDKPRGGRQSMSLFINYCIDHLPELRQINALSGWLLVGVVAAFALATIWDMIQDVRED